MTFDLGTWFTARRKNRLAVLCILILAGLSLAAAVKFDVEWLLGIALAFDAALLGPLVTAYGPGQKLALAINVLLPGYIDLTEIETRKAELREVVEAFAATVDEYRLGSAGIALRAALLARPPAARTEKQRLDHCARELLRLSGASHPHLTAPLLELLYREHTRKNDSRTAWASYKQDPAALAPLVQVLIGSGKLPRSAAAPGEIERILGPLEELAVDTVRDELDTLERIWRVSERWGRFLAAENDLPGASLSFAAVLDRIETNRKAAGKPGLPCRPREVEELPDAVLPVLRSIGDDSLRGKYPATPEGERQILCLIALAVFLTKVVPKEPSIESAIPSREWVKHLCGKLFALPESHAVVLAYLDLRADLKGKPAGKRPYVSIDQLASGWRARSAVRASDPGPLLEGELEHIRDQLNAGVFPSRLSPVTTPRRLVEVKKQYRSLLQLAEERKAVLATLRRTFQELTLGTVERFLESRGSDAYLLTFSTVHGNLADVIDGLVDPGLRRQAAADGIDLGKLRYDFRHYTNNARLGILPPGLPFEHFATALQRDLGLLVDAHGKLFPGAPALAGIEVLVHRFNLSEGDYFEVRHERVRRRAVLEVRALLGETLPAEQLVALVEYDGKVNVVDAILRGPIADLTGDEVPYTEDERKALELHDHELRSSLVLAHGAASVQELARRLAVADAADERHTAAGTLAGLLAAQVPALDPGRRAQAAESYVRTLAAVASIGRRPPAAAAAALRAA